MSTVIGALKKLEVMTMTKQIAKRYLSILLAMALAYSCSTFAFAANATSVRDTSNPITVQWTRTDFLAASLSISASGKATCSFNIELTYPTDTATVYMNFQRLVDGKWTTMWTWSKNGSGDFSGSQFYNLSKTGYYYRNSVDAYVYDSSGNFVEYVRQDSPQKYY